MGFFWFALIACIVLIGFMVYINLPGHGVSQLQHPDSVNDSYELPLSDSSGHDTENIWKVNIAGATHPHDGCNPQLIIPRLPVGSRLVLKPDSDNQYDKAAIKVLTESGKYIGWYPAAGLHHEKVFERLTSGQEVNAQLVDKGIVSGKNIWWSEMKIVVYK